MTNYKIIVCCHKNDIRHESETYLPLHVGKASSNVELGIAGDNTGDNISSKNQSYCELTGMYWAWKNLKGVDVIGLCHYRRYFDFYNQSESIIPFTKKSPTCIGELKFDVPEKILKKIKNGAVVVPRILNNVGSLYNEYCITHISDDIRILGEIINDTQEKKYIDAYKKVMFLNHKQHCFNMFVMNWEDFDRYCQWLFSILSEVEERVDISSYSPSQKRIFGYMAERLLNVYLYAERKEKIEKPVLFIMEGESGSKINYVIKSVLNNISFFLSTLYLRFKK